MPGLHLAAAAHADAPDARGIPVEAVDITLEGLPGHLAVDQLDVILGMVDSALRAQLERRVMEHHEIKNDMLRGLYEEAKAKAEAMVKAELRAEVKAEVEAESILTARPPARRAARSTAKRPAAKRAVRRAPVK